MTFKRICQLISLGLLIYLLFLSSLQIDIAPIKNAALNRQLLREIKGETSVLVLREKAERNLSILYNDRVRQSKNAQRVCLTLVGLIVVQVGILVTEYRKQ